MAYSLLDAEETAITNPDPFSIPSAIERMNLTPGALVKLHLTDEDGHEAMWASR